MSAHEVQENFPQHQEDLAAVDVLILSDIGANTLLLHLNTWLKDLPTLNRLNLRDWVLDGGALVMCGGYYSFQGINGGALYHLTPIEEVLTVSILTYDDRMEVPEGASADILEHNHDILSRIPDRWPLLLGYNRVEAKPDAEVLARINGNPLLVVGEAGDGRTLA